MGRIIVIDGTSNAGKTTLCENLERYMENIIIIPGASAFARSHRQKYPSIPPIPQSADEEKENQIFFFRLELDRLMEANRLAQKDKDVIMDRSILEILSVAYSFEIINNWKGIYRNAKNLYEQFISTSKECGIKLPDIHLWLQANAEEVIRRNKIRQMERGKQLSENEWIDESLINQQLDFFTKLCMPENKDRIKLINTNNKSRQDVLEEVRTVLNLKRKEREINND